MEGIDPGFRRPGFRQCAKRSYTAAACEDSDFFDYAPEQPEWQMNMVQNTEAETETE